jgi:pyruvate/2-oxoglutarate dehydrogenase complex dihydrolipoamide acyltransferase (E2) component
MFPVERHLRLKPLEKVSSWRKIAVGGWGNPGDPSVYAFLDVEADAALAFIEKSARQTGERVTLTHFAGRVIAEAFRRHPEINCIVRLGRLYRREDVSVFFQVATDSRGEDLTGVVIHRADEKSVSEIAAEMNLKVAAIRSNSDRSFARLKALFGALPNWAVKLVIDFSSFLMFRLNLWSPVFGTPKNAFGSVMVTNIGSLGMTRGLAPLVPYSHVPMVVALGAVEEVPVAHDGKIKVARRITLGVTFDHRLIDGVVGAKMAATIRSGFSDPEQFLSANKG